MGVLIVPATGGIRTVRVLQRAGSSSEWGDLGSLRDALAGELSQRVENSVRGEVLTCTDSSSEWAIWDVATRRFGV